MSKDDRSEINPFTGKKHYDVINDDEFLKESYNRYYSLINQSQILDSTQYGQIVINIAINLINAVENYLSEIGRIDYTQDYYDWEFHLIANDDVNAFCMPGGKIVMYSGILSLADTEDKIAFILGHEMAHALLDHARTRISAEKTKNTLTSATWFGSFALDLIGLGEIGSLTRATTNIVDVGSEFFLMKPWGRDQELEADKLGIMIIHWAGYDISSIPSFWQSMSKINSNNHDFFSTHPTDSKRIAAMREVITEIQNNKNFQLKQVLSKNPDDTSYLNKKYCQNCGHAENSDSKFCTNCGNRFIDELNCSRCGFKVNAQDSFCMMCGNKLK